MIAVPLLLALAQHEPPHIADNSFLVEEAYNQERRVVQHISAFARRADGSWQYTFTQEWPAVGQKVQLSFTLPTLGGAGRAGIGDLLLNYRQQIVGTQGALSVAPRLSVILPTGNEDRGRGSGAVGIQVNIPASVRVSPRLVTHWNLGVTGIPHTSTVLTGAASAIWEITPTLNALFEFTWSQIETDVTEMFVNPGIRWAYNVKNGLQIVPGIALPIGLGVSSGETAAFLYLSFEHPF